MEKMLGFAWLTLKQAQEALKNGRLEEAQQLVGHLGVQGHKRYWELARQLALDFVQRGERRLRQNHPEAAWNDLLAAEQWGSNDPAFALRHALTEQGMAAARALLERGEPGQALEAVVQLRERSVQQPELVTLEEAACGWQQAREHAQRGEFPMARDKIERVRRLVGEKNALVQQFQRDLAERQHTFTTLLVRLHEAAGQGRWREVVELTEQILAAAPQHAEARRTRAIAWKAIEPVTLAMRGSLKQEERREVDEASERFLLWIDGVGGYLVCLGNRVTFGQATTSNRVDVPVFADISRLHATLVRDSEGYLLEAARSAAVNGKPVERALLRPHDRITLGAACQMIFTQPSPISTSARLELVSGHRLPLALEGVLLMADTLLLGPGTQVHVAIPELKAPLVIYRHKDRLGVKYAGTLTIDGQRCSDRAILGSNSTIIGEEFSLTIEPVGAKMGRTQAMNDDQ